MRGVPPVREVTCEEGVEILDKRAREVLGISGAEFVRAWRAGEYAGRECEVIRVAMLLPFADEEL